MKSFIESPPPAPSATLTRWSDAKKFLRFLRTYGLYRTLYKAAGRGRGGKFLTALIRPRHSHDRDTAIIGCGQFGFSTIGPLVSRAVGNRFALCYDPDMERASRFADFYGAKVAATPEEIFGDTAITTVFIASNHASHAQYAVAALSAGKSVHVEKPLAVTEADLDALIQCARSAPEKFATGYNRPLSKAVKALRSEIAKQPGPLTLSCFVAMHVLDSSHWYRAPGEGGRICGNMSHWLDLAVHLLAACGPLPDLAISVRPANANSPDDDVAVVLTSTSGDLISIVTTSRGEPFEGIRESIWVQRGSLMANIDDFRSLNLWDGDRRKAVRYRRKDAGHEEAMLQVFKQPVRSLNEVEISARLTLAVAAAASRSMPQLTDVVFTPRGH